MKFILISILAVFTIATEAHAENYTIKNGACKVYRLKNNKWEIVDSATVSKTFPENANFSGSPLPSKTTWIKSPQGSDVFLLPDTCVEKQTAQTTQSSPPPEVPSKPAEPEPMAGSYSVFASYISFQESMSLSGPSGENYNLQSTVRGTSVGIDWTKPLMKSLSYDISGAFIFASSDVGSPSNQTAPAVAYSAGGVSIFGVDGEIGIDFKPGSGHVSIGPRFAVIYRTGSFPAPTGGYTVNSQHGVYGAELLQTKFDIRRFYFSPTFGLYSGASNFLWSIALGYRITSN